MAVQWVILLIGSGHGPWYFSCGCHSLASLPSFVRLKDIRIDFIAKKMGRFGYPVTRLVSNICALSVTGVILKTTPVVFATSMGGIDGAILPGGNELFRQALSVPLFLSVGLIFLAASIDVLKMLFGLAENEPEQS